MMNGDIRLGKVFGIEIFINKSWFFLFCFLVYMWIGVFGNIKGLPVVFQVLFSFLTVLIFFISFLCHEFAHCLVGRYYGLEMNKMTLMFFGAVAALNEDHYKKGPGTEFWMALAGPATSLLLGGIFMLLNKFSVPLFSSDSPVVVMFFFLSILNFILAFFNLFPAFPMDGGRIFRSSLWWIKGDLVGATKIACWISNIMLKAILPFMVFLYFGLLNAVFVLIICACFFVPACEDEYRRVKKMRDDGRL